MICPACGSSDIILEKENDVMCGMKLVTLCICDTCGIDWYDDVN